MTIRDLEEQLKDRLRIRAARNKRSMEEEVRAILKAALAADSGKSKSLTQSIRARIEPLGGVELELPQRDRSEISRSPRSCCFSTPTCFPNSLSRRRIRPSWRGWMHSREVSCLQRQSLARRYSTASHCCREVHGESSSERPQRPFLTRISRTKCCRSTLPPPPAGNRPISP